MECYIVRIYRRYEDPERNIVGVVEEVGQDAKQAFTNDRELREILAPERIRAGSHGGKSALSRSGEQSR
ncbi:MAG: hypothetical protein OEW15_00600 [Nitrospirota bacterium]|nr:hypothetical protein [Nitrospirota bacterium]